MSFVTFKMNKSDFVGWMAALRSGEYPQTQSFLKTEKGYCCLGVFCEINNIPIETGRIIPKIAINHQFNITMLGGSSGYHFNPWVAVPENYKGDNTTIIEYNGKHEKVVAIAALNDAGFTFNEIADILEQHVEFN